MGNLISSQKKYRYREFDSMKYEPLINEDILIKKDILNNEKIIDIITNISNDINNIKLNYISLTQKYNDLIILNTKIEELTCNVQDIRTLFSSQIYNINESNNIM